MSKSAALRHLGIFMALLLAAAGLGAQSQSQAVDVEVGYRWVDVTGNERLYRTQINDRQGILLRSLLYDSQGPLDGLDFFKVEASDMGAGPAGSFRLAAGRTNIFRIDFTYRRQDLYSALVDFANPFLATGVTVGQHTYNRVRDIYDVNVQILPVEDDHAHSRVHAQYLQRARNDDLQRGRRRLRPQSEPHGQRPGIPHRPPLQHRPRPGRRDAGLAAVPRERLGDARFREPAPATTPARCSASQLRPPASTERPKHRSTRRPRTPGSRGDSSTGSR